MNERKTLVIASAEKLKHKPVPGDPKVFMSGYKLTDVDGNEYVYPCEGTLLMGATLWINNTFAHRVKRFLKDYPDEKFEITARVVSGKLENPRFKGAA